MSRQAAAAAFAVALAALPAAARADLFSSVSYGVQASTIGHGITLEKPLLYDFSVRIQTGTMSVSQQFTYDGNPYTSDRRATTTSPSSPTTGRTPDGTASAAGSSSAATASTTSHAPTARSSTSATGIYPVSGTGTVSTRLRYGRPSHLRRRRHRHRARSAASRWRSTPASSSATARRPSPQPARSPLRAPPSAPTSNRLRGEQRTHVVVPVLSVGLVYRP